LLAAAPSSALSVAALSAKLASAERTVATPMSAFSSTICPPASAIACLRSSGRSPLARIA
jgi:hypothetical protein